MMRQNHFLLLILGALTLLIIPQPASAQPQQPKMVHQKDSEHPHKWISGPPTEIDCSLASSNYEYYIERCHDEITQWWVNGNCINGVKTEVSELHRCMKKNGGRSYCHDCNDGAEGAGTIKHVCGSDNPNYQEVCPVALSSNPNQDCPDDVVDGLTVYSHQCTSRTTSSYLRESFYCDEKEVYNTGPNTFTCGREWYYPYEEGDDSLFIANHPELNGQEQPFSTQSHKYCLECGMAIQVCASDAGATCVHLGLPVKGSDRMPEEADNSRYEGGE